ncbi:MAG: hypothetical protein AB2L14_21825 [Candidatus Xenobiia bacterium LiM19]
MESNEYRSSIAGDREMEERESSKGSLCDELTSAIGEMEKTEGACAPLACLLGKAEEIRKVLEQKRKTLMTAREERARYSMD